MKQIIFTPPTRADVRRIDRDQAMRILTALHRFAKTGEGDIKKLQGDSSDMRLWVGDYRVRFTEEPSDTLHVHSVGTARRSIDERPLNSVGGGRDSWLNHRGPEESGRGASDFGSSPFV